VVAYNDSRSVNATPFNVSGASVSSDGGLTFTRLTKANGHSPFENPVGDRVILYNKQTDTWRTSGYSPGSATAGWAGTVRPLRGILIAGPCTTALTVAVVPVTTAVGLVYDQTYNGVNVSSNGNAQFVTTDVDWTNVCPLPCRLTTTLSCPIGMTSAPTPMRAAQRSPVEHVVSSLLFPALRRTVSSTSNGARFISLILPRRPTTSCACMKARRISMWSTATSL